MTTLPPIEEATCPTCGRALPLPPDAEAELRTRIGESFKRHRLASGLTQKQLVAHVPPLGRSVYSRIETGDHEIDMVQLVAICGVIGVPWRAFLAEVFGE